MHVRRFTDANAFYQHVEPFLIQHEAENNLILGVTNGLRSGEFRQFPPYLSYVEQDGEIILVAIRTPPNNLVISHTDNLDAITALIQDVRQVYDWLAGVSATKETGGHFIEQWHALTGHPYRLAMPQGVYQLERVIPVENVEGSLRRADHSDRELLLQWIGGFYTDAFGTEAQADQTQQTTDRYLNSTPDMRGVYFWEVDGQPVSMAGYAGPTPNGLRVGAVYTPTELRRKGYASACTAALSQHILDMGRKYCFLFTDLNNPTSNHIYQEIGYEYICDVNDYRFDEV